jgi:hypothetical protein
VSQLFKEVPGHDPRTLVLKTDDETLVDLKFCSCQNKYKKRFAAFLEENPSFYEEISTVATYLANNRYKIDIRNVLGHLRVVAQTNVPASEYLKAYPHDFELDKLPREYLIRKLIIDHPHLADAFDLAPVKCKGTCGYPDTVAAEEPAESLAGF